MGQETLSNGATLCKLCAAQAVSTPERETRNRKPSLRKPLQLDISLHWTQNNKSLRQYKYRIILTNNANRSIEVLKKTAKKPLEEKPKRNHVNNGQ